MNTTRMVMLVIAVLLMLITLGLVGLGMLGLAGVLADVGPDENQKLGWQVLTFAAFPGILSILLAIFALFFKRQN